MIRDDLLFFPFTHQFQLAIFYYPRKVSHIINDFLSRAKNCKFTRFYRHYRLVKYNCCSDVGTNLNHKSDPFLWSAEEERAYCTGQSHVINNLLLVLMKNETLIRRRCKFLLSLNTTSILLFFLFIDDEEKTKNLNI